VANQTGSRSTDPSDPGRRPTKDERREQARAEREHLLRRQAARRRRRTYAIVAVVVLAIVAIAAVSLTSSGSGSTSASASTSTTTSPAPTDLPGMLTTPPPWGPNTDQLAQRLALLNLPGVSDVINHHHARLWIYDAGQQVTIPADIGLSQTAGAPLHTHVDNGVIHIEADDTSFEGTLGQFFDVWGKPLDATHVGDAVVPTGSQLWLFVDRKPITGDPRAIPLTAHAQIVLSDDARVPVHASYVFPPGL
jgi:hypothetical protein